MDAVCKMTGEATTWPCSAHGCPLYGDCLSEYVGNSKPMTNADRIRSMSDEELAEIFTRYSYEAHAKWYGPDQKNYWSMSVYALEAWLDWLQQPAEEET